jgi:ferredoxin-NADP reductase
MVMKKTYEVIGITQAASDVAVLTLSPRSDDDRLDFYPGQYATIGFKKSGRPTPMRCFSIVSSPHDTRILQFAMRIQGDFTKTASQLTPGTEAFVQGPFGSFVIDPDYDKKVVMIAGGIGITPFISMLRHAQATGLQTPITLLYGVRSQRDIPFYTEIVELERKNPNLQVAFFISDESIAPVPGGRFVAGKINEQRLGQVTGGSYHGITYFICGPKRFMRDLQNTIARKGVSPHRIVTESFAQTSKLTFGGKISIPKLTYALTAGAMVLGFGFFMALDLARFLPKEADAQSTTQQQSTATTTPTTSSPDTTNTNATTDNSNTSTNTPSTSTQNTPQPAQPQYQYRRPVSSMS